MKLLNDSFKQISIIHLLIVAILAIFAMIFLEDIFPITVPMEFVNIVLIIFIVFKLVKGNYDFKGNINKVLTDFPLKLVFLIVILNIFFSYGMIYLSDVLLVLFPDLESFVFYTTTASTSIVAVGSFISSVFIAPISEEFVFRGVFLNRLNKYFSVHIAILVSSVLFGICHDFGGMFSAFVFGICMCILYIKTSNIFVPMIAHGLNNLLSEVIVFVDYGDFIFTNDIVIILLSILAIISAYLLFTSIRQEWKKLS